MLSYYFKWNTESKNPKVVKTKIEKKMLLSKCAVFDSKNSKFIKKQEATRLWNSLGIKTPLTKIPLVGKIWNTFLLAGDTCISEMHLRQPGCTYSACGPFTKNKERIQKSKKQEIYNKFIETN